MVRIYMVKLTSGWSLGSSSVVAALHRLRLLCSLGLHEWGQHQKRMWSVKHIFCFSRLVPFWNLKCVHIQILDPSRLLHVFRGHSNNIRDTLGSIQFLPCVTRERRVISKMWNNVAFLKGLFSETLWLFLILGRSNWRDLRHISDVMCLVKPPI